MEVMVVMVEEAIYGVELRFRHWGLSQGILKAVDLCTALHHGPCDFFEATGQVKFTYICRELEAASPARDR